MLYHCTTGACWLFLLFLYCNYHVFQTQCGTLITIIIAKAMYKTIVRPYILHYRKCCITVHYRKCGIRLHHNNYITKCMHLESVYIYILHSLLLVQACP